MANRGMLAKSESFGIEKKDAASRLRSIEFREAIHDSGVLQTILAMAATGRDIRIDRETGEPIDVGELDSNLRVKLMTSLISKVVPNVAPTKAPDEQSNNARWIEILETHENKKTPRD